MTNYNVGSIIVEALVVSSPRGNLDLSSSFYTASIFESVFTPGTVCDIVVMDTGDYIKALKISGDETVIFRFKVPGGVKAEFIFHLNSIQDVASVGAQKAKSYTLQCISKEIMHSKTNLIQKHYNALCSDIMTDIHSQYLKSAKPLIEIEKSSGPQNILIPSLYPFKALSMVKKRAVSSENKSSVYVYFETRENERQVYKFVTLAKLFARGAVKSFKQTDAMNVNVVGSLPDNNILSFAIPDQISSIDKVRYGGPRQVTQMNFTTHEQISKTIDTTKSDTSISDAFAREFFKDVRHAPQSLVPVDTSQRSVTKIAETSPNVESYLASLLQNSMKIRVPGDTILSAGSTIKCSIPGRSGLTSPAKDDSQMSGKFLITRIHHRIGMAVEQPRYTCVIECVKINYEDL